MQPTTDSLPSQPSRASRAMAIARRWLSAAAGLILLAMTLSGTVSPYQGEVMRSLKPAAHTRAPVPDRVSLPQAIETI